MSATTLGTIIIIDDDPGIRELFEYLVMDVIEAQQRGRYTIFSTGNSNDALTEIAKGQTKLVIQDLYRPGSNGLKLMAALRQQYSKQELPIIVVTGRISEQLTEAYLEAEGANAVVQKPAISPGLEEVVAYWLSQE